MNCARPPIGGPNPFQSLKLTQRAMSTGMARKTPTMMIAGRVNSHPASPSRPRMPAGRLPVLTAIAS